MKLNNEQKLEVDKNFYTFLKYGVVFALFCYMYLFFSLLTIDIFQFNLILSLSGILFCIILIEILNYLLRIIKDGKNEKQA